MIFKLHPNSLFEDGTGPGLEPVGGEFQRSFEIVHPGGGAYLIFMLKLKMQEAASACFLHFFNQVTWSLFDLFSLGMALGAGGRRVLGIVGLVVGLVAVAAIHVKGLADIFQFLLVRELGGVLTFGGFTALFVALDAPFHLLTGRKIDPRFILVIVMAGAAFVLVQIGCLFGVLVDMFLMAEFNDPLGVLAPFVLNLDLLLHLGGGIDSG